jgi:hypothetical protein
LYVLSDDFVDSLSTGKRRKERHAEERQRRPNLIKSHSSEFYQLAKLKILYKIAAGGRYGLSRSSLMPSSIASVTHAQPAAPVQATPAATKSNQPKSQPAKTPTDTVQLSAAAQAQAAAIKELSETRVQTDQEANGGDLQAQRLLAKENTNK